MDKDDYIWLITAGLVLPYLAAAATAWVGKSKPQNLGEVSDEDTDSELLGR